MTIESGDELAGCGLADIEFILPPLYDPLSSSWNGRRIEKIPNGIRLFQYDPVFPSLPNPFDPATIL